MAQDFEQMFKKVKSTAPGIYLGFAIQPVRMCHHLMVSSDNENVSLEYIDDIAVHSSDGSLVLEQCKSALTGNPTADGSTELWKTFANWARFCKEHGIDPINTKFRLYVCTSKLPGKLVIAAHEATSDQQAQILLVKIAKKITSKNAGKGCNPKILEFLSHDEQCKLSIIRNFELVVTIDPLEAIRANLRIALPKESVDDFAEAAIGQVSTEILSLIRGGQKPIINCERFRQSFQAYVRRYNWTGILPSTIDPPTKNHANQIVKVALRFIQQLQAIDAGQEILMRAAADFLQSEADRTHWAAEGKIVAHSINELDDQLCRSHLLQRTEIEDTLSHIEKKARGRTLYVRCSQLSIMLEGRPLPTYFVPGSFNILADELKLGWHPEYTVLFAK